MNTINKLINNLLSGLNNRQKEIITKRFGLDGKEIKKLAFLGKKFGITRERVRQIQNVSLKICRNKISNFKEWEEFINKFKKILKENGGVLRVDRLLEEITKLNNNHNLNYNLNKNKLYFLIKLSNGISFYKEDDNFYEFYYLDGVDLKNIFSFVNQWLKKVNSHKEEILAGNYHKLFEQFVKGKKINKNHAINFISLSKKIMINTYGNIGLRDWPEINPKVIRDKIYLVLKNKNTPLHFHKIAQAINEDGLSKKPVLSSTVHNELIKDKKFVLVGRGIYALQEWGYEPGTALETIVRLLKKEGPMKPKDIILAVQKNKFFKTNTILVNLQNKKHFERLADGTYRVKEA